MKKIYSPKLVTCLWHFVDKMSAPRKIFMALLLSFILLLPYFLWSVPKTDAAITYVSSSTITTSGGTSLSFTKPAGTQEGDYMLVSIAINSTSVTVNAPNGTWTSVLSTNGTGMRIQTWRHVVGTESGPYSFSWTGGQTAAGGLEVYRGVDSGGTNGSNGIDVSGAGNSGSGTSLSTVNNSISTTSANAIIVSAFGLTLSSGLGGTTSVITANNTSPNVARFSANTSCGALCTNASSAGGEVLQAAAGQISSKTATATNSGNWAAHVVALKLMAAPTLQQSSYRFLSNMDSDNPEYINYNPGGNDDFIKGIAIDSTNGYLYMGGNNNGDWIMQKRRLDDGSLVSGFGTGGTKTNGIPGAGEAVASLVLDITDNSFFIAGHRASGGDNVWRIEKRNATTAELCSSTSNCPVIFDSDGFIEIGFESQDAEVYAMTLDSTNGYLYVGGMSRNVSSNTNQWRVAKYSISTGTLDTAWGSSGYITFDNSTGDDRVKALAVDPSGGYLYAGGYETNVDQQWRIEKRKLSSGNLCTAAECGTAFGSGGAYTSDPDASNDDQLLAFQVDTPGNAIYAGGYDYLDATNNNQWRIEKLTATSGSLVSEFGTGGVVNYDSGTSGGDDKIIDIDLDDYGGYIFTTGQVLNTDATPDLEWRIEKRRRSDGALCTAAACGTQFGTNGVTRIDPSGNNDSPAWISVDLPRNILYTSGGDRSLGTSNQQWRIVKIHMDLGGVWLGAEDTATVLSTETTFRLRLLIHAGTNTMFANDINLKLKYATKIGTCDTSGVGETYNDVLTASGEVRYNDNASLSESAALVGLTGDPQHGTDTTVLQSIEEANNFSNINNVLASRDGMWDFVLKDVGAFGAYCFKVVDSSNNDIGSPVLMPELSFCRNDPRTENVLRHGTYFCEGIKKSFFWSREF